MPRCRTGPVFSSVMEMLTPAQEGHLVHFFPITHRVKPSRQPEKSHEWYVYSTAVVKRCQYWQAALPSRQPVIKTFASTPLSALNSSCGQRCWCEYGQQADSPSSARTKLTTNKARQFLPVNFPCLGIYCYRMALMPGLSLILDVSGIIVLQVNMY